MAETTKETTQSPSQAMKSYRLTEDEYHLLKVITSMKQMSMSDFYDEALTDMRKEREAWGEANEDDFVRFPWIPAPSPNKSQSKDDIDDTKRVIAQATESILEPLEAYMKVDRVNWTDLVYTAVYKKMLKLRKEIKESSPLM